jgi:hypothetical protein
LVETRDEDTTLNLEGQGVSNQRPRIFLYRAYLFAVIAGVFCIFSGTIVLGLQSTGPDVIVGDISGVTPADAQSNPTVFKVGTTSCNIGDHALDWIADPNPLHPAISHNLYRLRNGRLEHLAATWCKHGFAVAPGDLCGTCQDPAGNRLGVGCSDPYGPGLFTQGALGPRSQVSPRTGPAVDSSGNMIPLRHLTNPGRADGLLWINDADINASDLYFVEAQYIHVQDAKAGNDANNASFRQLSVTANPGGPATLSFQNSTTQRTKTAIDGWKAQDSQVIVRNVDVPNDGRFNVGIRSTQQGGHWHHEIALHNLSSARCGQGLSITTSGGAVMNAGFHAVSPDQEPFSRNPWSSQAQGSTMTWSTDTFAANPNANALRWGTTYSFWLDSAQPLASMTLNLFQPASGQPDSMPIDPTGN